MTAASRYRPLSVRRVWAIHGAAALVVALTAAAALIAHVPGLFAVPGAVLGVEVGVWIWLSRRAGRLVQRMGDAAMLVEQGAYAPAAAQLDALADEARLIPNLHALITQRRADIHFACGELDSAEALALAVADSGWFARRGSALYVAYPNLCALLAVIAALRDRPEIVATWEARSRRAVTDARKSTLVFMDAVLAARAHRFSEVTKLELAAARGPYGAVLRWVIAYATAQTPSARDRLASRTEAARASTVESLALAPYWPELAAFVATS
jgi:hypothetical protein